MAHYHADVMEPLTYDETCDLASHEATITAGIETFYAVGQALSRIRDRRLYRAMFPTFAAYCAQRWQMTRQRGYQLIQAAGVMDTLSTGVDTALLPLHESHARVLATVAPEYVEKVWDLTLQTTPHNDPKEVTASHIRDVVEVINQARATGGFVDADTGESEPVTPTSFKAAVLVEKVEKLARQYEHMTRKRERVLKVSSTIHKFGSQDGCETVTLKLPPGTDTAALRAAWRNGLELFVSMYTERELS